jgi:shikimate kinase
MEKGHIFLTGFMGSGKSTLGKKLAALMKIPFVDLDAYIETATGRSIPDIFAAEGEAYFRTLESKHLVELAEKPERTVIALGGGTVCFNNNLDLVKDRGLLVFIDLPAVTLAQRVSASPEKRPLIQGLAGKSLVSWIEQKLEERKKYYTQAHLVANGLNLNARLLLRQILEHSEKNN